MMNKQLLIGMLICLNGVYAEAQWTKKDSLWLQDVQSGKEKLKLNPETMKAIESGFLINPERPALELRSQPASKLPIIKDFSAYIQSDDSTHRKLALKDLPSPVFWRHIPRSAAPLSIYQSIIDELKREPLQGAVGNGMINILLDVGELTSRKAFIHKRNAKRDVTWANYAAPSTSEVVRKREQTINANPSLIRQDSIKRRDTLKTRSDSASMLTLPKNN